MNFDQPIEKDVLPTGLQSLVFGRNFNQPIEKDVFPAGLQLIQFGHYFYQPIDNISEKTKVYIWNIPRNMSHNYTLYQDMKSDLEKLVFEIPTEYQKFMARELSRVKSLAKYQGSTLFEYMQMAAYNWLEYKKNNGIVPKPRIEEMTKIYISKINDVEYYMIDVD